MLKEIIETLKEMNKQRVIDSLSAVDKEALLNGIKYDQIDIVKVQTYLEKGARK